MMDDGGEIKARGRLFRAVGFRTARGTGGRLSTAGLASILSFLGVVGSCDEPAGPAIGQARVLWGDLRAGPHAVGFRAIFAADSSRRYWPEGDATDPAYRPLRVFVWYPAQETGDRMRFGDYFAPQEGLDAPVRDVEAALLVRDTFMVRFWSGFEPSHVLTLFDLPTAASRGAPPLAGPFPIVLNSLATGGYQQENVVLWEYLASHGYVVVAIPQLHARWPRIRLGSMSDLENPETQVRDLEYARRIAARLPFADPSRIGLVGYSGGSVYALFMAMRNGDVDALVSLDGTITFDNGRRLLGMPHYAPEHLSIPVLNLYKGTEAPDSALMSTLTRADRYWVELPRTIHMDFQQFPMLNAIDTTAVRSSRGRSVRAHDEARRSYEAMATILRSFLDATLGGNPEDWERTAEEPAGLGFAVGTAIVHPPAPRTGEATAVEVAGRLVARAASGETLDAVVANAALAGLDPDELGAIGGDLMSHRTPPRARAALAMLGLAARLDPENPFRLYELGDAHLSTGIEPERGYEYWRDFVERADAAGISDWRVDTARDALESRSR